MQICVIARLAEPTLLRPQCTYSELMLICVFAVETRTQQLTTKFDAAITAYIDRCILDIWTMCATTWEAEDDFAVFATSGFSM